MLGIRKIGETQIDLYVGDFSEFSCDAWCFIVDQGRGHSQLDPSLGEFMGAVEGLPETLQVFQTKYASCHSSTFYSITHQSILDSKIDLIKALSFAGKKYRVSHLALVLDQNIAQNVAFKHLLLEKIKNENLTMRRLTIILGKVDEYKLWQETLWKVIPLDL